MTIKAIAKIRAFYNGAIIKPGQRFDFKGDVYSLPTWAKAVATQENTQKGQTPQSPSEQNQQGSQNQPQNDNTENGVKELEIPEDLKGKTVGELGVILDELITKGLDANIELDNIENKTVIEQIIELRTKLAQREKDGEQK